MSLEYKKFLINALKFQNELEIENIFDFINGRTHSFKNFERLDDKIIKEEKNIQAVKKNFFTIEEIKNILNKKTEIQIAKTAKNIVIGDGNQSAKIIIIGEAPGEQEDEIGIPFCGKSGKLLEKAFSEINLNRKNNLFITNTVFWRPTNNRQPYQEEIEYCLPYLLDIISIINPKIIITAGAIATKVFLNDKNISLSIGKFHKAKECLNLNEVQVFPIYHPAYLIRNPSAKKTLWQNLLYFSDNYQKFL